MTHTASGVSTTLGLVLVLAFATILVSACGGDDSGPAETPTVAVAADDRDPRGLDMNATTILHHWEALIAIDAEDADGARHHVGHILTAVEGDEIHLDAMTAVLASIDAGELDEASHGIEEMLTDRAEPLVSMQQLHVQMALDALDAEDVAEAIHHARHFADNAADDHEAAEADELLGLLESGDHHQAEELLASLLAGFASDAHDDASHDGDAHDGDAHDDDGDTSRMDFDREIDVIATEFAYSPIEIHASVGEVIKMILVNDGVALHDITTDDFQGSATASGDMADHDSSAGDHEDRGFHAAAEGGQTVELIFEASEPGEYELYCSVPGHRELGMTARLIVEAANTQR